MNKRDLVKKMSKQLSFSERDCKLFLECYTTLVMDVLCENESVKLPVLGRLSPHLQTARPGRNPRTGIECEVPERLSVRFKASKMLIEALNKKDKKKN